MLLSTLWIITLLLTKVIIYNVDSSMSTFRVPINNINSSIISNKLMHY